MSTSIGTINAVQNEALWRERIARQEASGKTIAVFCLEEGVGKSTFSNWRRRLRAIEVAVAAQKSSALGAPFLDLGALKPRGPDGSDRVPYESAGAVEVRLELGGGVVVHIARH